MGCVSGCVCELCCFIFYFRWGGGGATAHLPLTVLRFSAAPLSLSPRNVPLHLCRPKFCKLGSFNLFVVIRRRVLRWARPQNAPNIRGGRRRAPAGWALTFPLVSSSQTRVTAGKNAHRYKHETHMCVFCSRASPRKAAHKHTHVASQRIAAADCHRSLLGRALPPCAR